MNREEIQAKLNGCTVESIALAHKWDAAKKTFDAANFVGDGTTADHQRQVMHALLDQQLDNAQSVLVLTRKLVESQE